MKNLCLFILLFSTGARAFLHPVLEKNYEISNKVEFSLNLEWENVQDLTSCKAIDLRLKRLVELKDELHFLNNTQQSDLDQQFAHLLIKTLITEQSVELYNLLFDRDEHIAKIDLEEFSFGKDDFLYAVVAGEAKVYFNNEETRDLKVEGSKLLLGLSNYQACIPKKVDLFILRGCSPKTYADLIKCQSHKVDLFEVKIPKINLQRGNLRRTRWE